MYAIYVEGEWVKDADLSTCEYSKTTRGCFTFRNAVRVAARWSHLWDQWRLVKVA